MCSLWLGRMLPQPDMISIGEVFEFWRFDADLTRDAKKIDNPGDVQMSVQNLNYLFR